MNRNSEHVDTSETTNRTSEHTKVRKVEQTNKYSRQQLRYRSRKSRTSARPQVRYRSQNKQCFQIIRNTSSEIRLNTKHIEHRHRNNSYVQTHICSMHSTMLLVSISSPNKAHLVIVLNIPCSMDLNTFFIF